MGGTVWNCDDCSKEEQKLRGCHGGAKLPTLLVTGDYSNTCPVRLGAKVEPVLREYSHWKAGRLFNPGTYADQPGVYIELMRLIDNLIIQRQKQDNEQ